MIENQVELTLRTLVLVLPRNLRSVSKVQDNKPCTIYDCEGVLRFGSFPRTAPYRLGDENLCIEGLWGWSCDITPGHRIVSEEVFDITRESVDLCTTDTVPQRVILVIQ